MKLGAKFWIVETIRFIIMLATLLVWVMFLTFASMVTATVG